MDRKYIDIFVREAEEHILALQQGLIALEKDGFSPAKVHELLRSAHTIKGSAMLVNLTEIGEVAHQMEDLFKEIEQETRPLSPGLIDLLLVATDAVEALVTRANSGLDLQIDTASVLASLAAGELVTPQPSTTVEPKTKKDFEGSERRQTVRASVEKLDFLGNQIGELLITRQNFEDKVRRFTALNRRLESFMGGLRKAENYRLVKQLLDDYARLSTEIERGTFSLGTQSESLHDAAMQLRMLPLATITDDLNRLTRDLAREQGKEIELLLSGEAVELDRMMLDAIRPMLLHMLRNSIDHGIETPAERIAAGKLPGGRISLSARYEGRNVELLLIDDGAGIDPQTVRRVAMERGILTAEEAAVLSDDDALYLILRPGFSTRSFITDVSGRGVGMDVVKTNIDLVKGNLIIRSTPGRGTEMLMQFPLTMAIIDGLLVTCGDESYAIPLHYVAEVLRLQVGDIQHDFGRESLRLHGESIPLVSLARTLDPAAPDKTDHGRATAVLLRFRNRKLAFLVSRTIGEQNLVVKGTGSQLRSVEFFSGATILGDGTPLLILSVPDLFNEGQIGKTRLRDAYAKEQSDQRRGRILVVDDSITTRTMEKNILEAHGYEVTIAVSGFDALAKLADAVFDLMISDVEMPGMTGFELTREVRQQEATRNMPVIICTSLATDSHKRLGMEVGAQAYIVKGSFDQGTLLETVESLIA